ncbi:MAG: two pore domain potassium channel family protein [Desulfobulbaceae bacterium]|nr:MAG: two pore domain potassium channel family protein [Desulfobulbaceae bacterium]
MEFTVDFLELFFKGVMLFYQIIVFLSLVIVLLGQIAGRLEKWTRFDALYWSLITALTIGYGDMRPVRRITRVFSIIIGLTGIILTGILVTISVQAASRAYGIHVL